MRGIYNLTEEELDLYTGTIQAIIARLCLPSFRREQIELSKLDIAPCHVDDILKNLGWTRESFESNGWENDTWYYYTNTAYDFGLVMFYCGYTFKLVLYRTDIDDE